MRVLLFICKVEESIRRALTWTGAVGLGVICLVMLVQILMRRIFNRPIVWAEDLTVYVFIWITFIGAAVLFSRRELISVETLAELLPRKVRLSVEGFVDVVVLAGLLYLGKLAIGFMQRQYSLGHNLGGALGVPSWTVTLAVFVSLAVMTLSSVTSLAKKIAVPRTSRGDNANEK